jgi:hypothetical protein
MTPPMLPAPIHSRRDFSACLINVPGDLGFAHLPFGVEGDGGLLQVTATIKSPALIIFKSVEAMTQIESDGGQLFVIDERIPYELMEK